MPFKMHKIIFFPRKKIIKKKYVCLSYLIFQTCYLSITHFLFLFGLIILLTFPGTQRVKEKTQQTNTQFKILVLILSASIEDSDDPARAFAARTGILLPFSSLGQGPVEFWEKTFGPSKLGKLDGLKQPDRHFKWIKKI